MMDLLFFGSLFVVFVATCGAAIVAGEARRLGDPRSFRIALSCGIRLGVATLVLFSAGTTRHMFEFNRPDHPPGFGPEWHCSSASRGGGFCIKDGPDRTPP